MNIEEAIDILVPKENIDLSNHFNNTRFFEAIYTLLTAYEKEKKKNKRLEKFIENGEHTWKQKYNETFEYFKQELKEKEEENKRLRKCHLQYEEMTGIDLLLPEKEE